LTFRCQTFDQWPGIVGNETDFLSGLGGVLIENRLDMFFIARRVNDEFRRPRRARRQHQAARDR
jgi:hypothetical protein